MGTPPATGGAALGLGGAPRPGSSGWPARTRRWRKHSGSDQHQAPVHLQGCAGPRQVAETRLSAHPLAIAGLEGEWYQARA